MCGDGITAKLAIFCRENICHFLPFVKKCAANQTVPKIAKFYRENICIFWQCQKVRIKPNNSKIGNMGNKKWETGEK
jgi:hypothetical protein